METPFSPLFTLYPTILTQHSIKTIALGCLLQATQMTVETIGIA
jgi:hypothetical protein